jgi:hypothetical protein
MIGGLLRFAPGRLGARQDRAPWWCVIRWMVVSWLPYVTPPDELDPEPDEVRRVRAGLDRDGNRQRTARQRQPWLAEESEWVRAKSGAALRAMAGVGAGLRG